MLGTVIEIDKDGEVLLGKKFAQLVPQFNAVLEDKNLGGTMMKYIILVYDEKSPLRHLPYQIRKEDVAETLFGKRNYPRCNHKKVQKAIELYRYVQYNEIRDEYETMKDRHAQRLKVLEEIDKDNVTSSMNLDDKILAAGEKLEKLKLRKETSEEEAKMLGKDSGNISFIEERLIKHQKEEL